MKTRTRWKEMKIYRVGRQRSFNSEIGWYGWCASLAGSRTSFRSYSGDPSQDRSYTARDNLV